MLFRDRDEAGELLADVLLNLRSERPVVLGIPTGGIVVARRVADRLGAPLGAVGGAAGDGCLTGADLARAVSGRTVIVVDDGIRTGASMLAALTTIGAAGPARVIAAAPVAPQRLSLGRLCDDLYAVARPEPLGDIRRWYVELPEVDPREVREVLGGPGRPASTQDWAYAGATSL